MQTPAGTALQKRCPALQERLQCLDKSLDELSNLVEVLRSDLNIFGDPTNTVETAPPPAQNRVEARASEIEDLTGRLNCLIARLAPVVEAVKEI